MQRRTLQELETAQINLEAWHAHNQTVLHDRMIEQSQEHAEWMDENFDNHCLNCGNPVGHNHTC